MIGTQLDSPEAPGLLAILDKQTPELFQRYRVTLLTDQALALARCGDIEASARLLEQGAQRNQRIRSAEKTARILTVRAGLWSRAGGRALKALDEALQSTRMQNLPGPA